MKKVLISLIAVMFMAGSLMAGDFTSVKKLYADKKYAEFIAAAKVLLPTLKGSEKCQMQSWIGLALPSDKKYDEAIAELGKIATMPEASQEQKEQAILHIAQTLRLAKRPADAITALQPLTNSKIDSKRILSKQAIANALYALEKYPESIAAYETAIADLGQTAQQKALCYIWIGRICASNIKNVEKSFSAYKQVILLTDNKAFMAEAMRAKKEVGAKELSVTLEARKKAPVFESLLKLCYEKVFDEKSTLSTYDQVFCLAEMEKLLDEATYPAELSAIWTRINRLTGIVGVNRAALEAWLKANK